MFEPLTLRRIDARPVLLRLARPIVARIATIADWPLILIDLQTEEGIVGRSYLEPYVVRTMKYIVPALHDLGDMLKGRRVAPFELYDAARKSLHFVGYQGLSMIAVSGLDMETHIEIAPPGGGQSSRLDPELENTVYRLVQEALTNAVKHAGAEHAWVDITGNDTELAVAVRDDGSGFEPASPSAGFGLIGMRERVELAGGRLAIESTPSGGTRVSASLPRGRHP